MDEFKQEIIDNHPFTTVVCTTCGHEHAFPKYCGNRFCPVCSGGRCHRIYVRLNSFFEVPTNRRNLSMITLTLKNMDDLKKMCRKLIDDFSTFRNRKVWKAHVQGGAYVIEVTLNDKTQQWHAHIHALVRSDYFDNFIISFFWKKISGSYRTNIKTVYNDPAAYLTKHLTKKAGDVMLTRLDEMNEALRDFRLFQPFGSWFNAIPKYAKNKLVCENCGDSGCFQTWKAIDFYFDKGYLPYQKRRKVV